MSNINDGDDDNGDDDTKRLLSIYCDLGTGPTSSYLIFLLCESEQHFGRPPSKGHANAGQLLG